MIKLGLKEKREALIAELNTRFPQGRGLLLQSMLAIVDDLGALSSIQQQVAKLQEKLEKYRLAAPHEQQQIRIAMIDAYTKLNSHYRLVLALQYVAGQLPASAASDKAVTKQRAQLSQLTQILSAMAHQYEGVFANVPVHEEMRAIIREVPTTVTMARTPMAPPPTFHTQASRDAEASAAAAAVSSLDPQTDGPSRVPTLTQS